MIIEKVFVLRFTFVETVTNIIDKDNSENITIKKVMFPSLLFFGTEVSDFTMKTILVKDFAQLTVCTSA